MNKSTNEEEPKPSPRSQDFVVVGRIRGVWGLRGDLRVEVLTDFPQRFEAGELLYLRKRPAKVVRSRPSKKGLIVGLDIVTDRTMAESLRGEELSIPLKQVKPLTEGSYYYFQLLGMDVWNCEGDYLGTVKEILSTEGNDVYVVAEEGHREVLIPALKDLILNVDVQKNRMVVKLPDFL